MHALSVLETWSQCNHGRRSLGHTIDPTCALSTYHDGVMTMCLNLRSRNKVADLKGYTERANCESVITLCN